MRIKRHIIFISEKDALTKCCDPVDCMNRGLSLREIEKEVKGEIAEKLAKYETTTSGRADNRWYYVAPLLLDGAGYVTGWLGSDEALAFLTMRRKRRGGRKFF